MRIGVSLRSGYTLDDPAVGARWMVERARAAREAGLDSLFVGDHHNVGIAYYQNVPILGRLLAEWPDRTAGALFLLPVWHPVLVAEQVGTLAAIGGGPFVLQCAIGGGRDQFGAFGVDLAERPTRFEAALDVVRRLLAGEVVHDPDGPWPIDHARIGTVPNEPVAVWIGAAAPRAVDRAARLGDGFIAGPETTPERAGPLLAQFLERAAAHGRDPADRVIRRDVHVGADAADARRVAGPVVDGGYRGFDPSALVVGGPSEVAAAFADLGAAGYTEVLVRHLAEDHGAVLASFERLAEVRRLLTGT